MGPLPSAQMLACGRPEAYRICMLSVPRALHPPVMSNTRALITGPLPDAASFEAPRCLQQVYGRRPGHSERRCSGTRPPCRSHSRGTECATWRCRSHKSPRMQSERHTPRCARRPPLCTDAVTAARRVGHVLVAVGAGNQQRARPQSHVRFDRLVLRLEIVSDMRRREAQCDDAVARQRRKCPSLAASDRPDR